jgi:hypothetical protein
MESRLERTLATRRPTRGRLRHAHASLLVEEDVVLELAPRRAVAVALRGANSRAVAGGGRAGPRSSAGRRAGDAAEARGPRAAPLAPSPPAVVS